MSGDVGNGASAATAANQSWRNPSIPDQQQYSLQPFEDDFEPTPEEQSLLKMYQTIRSYEKAAARLKDAAARAKLAAREAEFQKQQGMSGEGRPAKRPKKKKAKAETYDENDMLDGSDDSIVSDVNSEDEEEEEKTAEEKLQALRNEVEAKMKAEAKQEELRKELLAGTGTGEDEGPMLKRKRAEQTEFSLISSLANRGTPPHDFSKKLKLGPLNGRKLFPTTREQDEWTPDSNASSPDDGALTLELNDFDVSKAMNGGGNNTVAIKFMAPENSKRFSINIAGPDHHNFESVLFHVNPRQRERGGQLVLNNKQEGTWGQAINIKLNSIPKIFTDHACTFIIQINGEGFDVFLNNRHIARLEHREELASGRISLYLNFPATDDYGKPESWTVYKVWWGNKPSMAKGDMSRVAGYKTFNSIHPRKLFISKLTKMRTDPEVDLRRSELEREFGQYGGGRFTVSVQKHSTFAFVEFETERAADLALQEMQGQYRIDRARKTRHEILQEERKRQEKMKESEWD